MKLVEVAQCKTDLDFRPKPRLPKALPPLAWRGYLISGFGSQAALALELEGALPELLRDLYGDFSWPELVRLSRSLLSTNLESVVPELLYVLELRWQEELPSLLTLIETMPLEFQDWLEEKRPGLREILPLQLVSGSSSGVERVFQAFDAKFLSRSLGSQLLEGLCELVAAQSFEIQILTKGATENFEAWHTRLKSLRYPIASGRDQEKVTKLRNIAWPLETQGRWVRKGDEAVLEIQMTATNPNDYHKKVARLVEIQSQLEKELWAKTEQPQ